MTDSNGDEGEIRLVRHLIDRVREGLSGRDGENLVDVDPLRSIFAGVLQAPRESDEIAASRGLVTRQAPTGTALGLDFKVRPNGSPKVTLSATVTWAHYYPVFPSWEQARAVNEAIPTEPAQSRQELGAASGDASEIREAVEVEDGDVQIDKDEPDANLDEVEANSDTPDGERRGKVILPRVWKRVPVTVDVAPSSINLTSRNTAFIGAAAIDSQIEEARRAAASDPNAWHHLGEPKKRHRALGDATTLATEGAYKDALAQKAGSGVVPPEWRAQLQVTSEPVIGEDGVWRVRVLFANVTPEADWDEGDPNLEQRALFDTCVELRIADGHLEPFDFVLAPKDYRSDSVMAAKGINCSAVLVGESPPELRTETLPIYAQPLYRTRDGMGVSFESLIGANSIETLVQISNSMRSYAVEWNDFLTSPAGQGMLTAQRKACEADKNAFDRERVGFELGIEALRRDHALFEAFCLMNKAFAVLGERSGGRLESWRLFQIAFICSQLPSLAVRELDAHAEDEFSEQVREEFAKVGVLWFPTGGGKTEAYLGLIAVALLYDRIRGKSRGVTAWMRFPLRMLSLQQLERLSKVIAVLNEMRTSEPSVSGGDPFAIGYYVGDNNTPNQVPDETMRRYEKSPVLRDAVKIIRQCPHCESAVRVDVDRKSWRIKHVCENADCFSNRDASLGALRGSLPVYVVDHEIYRYLPAVLVGTVDKLAIMGRNRAFTHLIRGVQRRCPEHGYVAYDACIEKWNAGCKRTPSLLEKLEPVSDPAPSLLIQDEMHLLRDELGVFNGHYEGLLRHLCTVASMPPKILCATATIEAYDVQAFHIYLATASRFPQPGWRQGESFYATSSPLRYRRFYVGLSNHTRAIEDSALRVASLYQREIRRLRANLSLAQRIMAGVEDGGNLDAPVLSLHDLSVCYVNKKAVGGSIIEKLSRASVLLDRQGLGELKGELLTGDQTIDEVGATLDRIEHEMTDAGDKLDVLAATNLISHDVDLERINMMAICGVPSHYAEYLQATSRSARSHPGVVFVCFNSREPRERSQFEFFFPMHEHLDRLIEAVAVNRFASYAPHKTVPGILIGLLLHEYTPDLFGRRVAKPLDDVMTFQGALGMKPAKGGQCLQRDELVSTIQSVIGLDAVRGPVSQAQIDNARRQVELTFDDLIGAIGRTLENRLQDVIDPLTSFRDVDEGIEFGSIDSATLMTRTRSR